MVEDSMRLQPGDTLKDGDARIVTAENQQKSRERRDQMMQEMRSYVDAIPTPGRDAGDTIGDFSLFAVAKDVLSGALTLMEAPYRSTTPEDIFQATVDMGPGMMSVATKGPAGAIGMFGSKPGMWASKEIHDKYSEMLKQAQHMEETGDPLRKIWEKTGMSKDHEGKWRYEISDGEDTRVNWDPIDDLRDNMGLPGNYKMLSQVLDSPRVYQHWPELKDVFVKAYRDPQESEYGHYNINDNVIHLNMARFVGTEGEMDSLRRTLIHEAQHALQFSQGRPSGTSPEWANKQMQKAVDAVDRAATRAMDRGELTNTQEEALHRMFEVTNRWKQMKAFFGDGKAAYYADPGEVEASLTEQSLYNVGKLKHPDDRSGPGIVPPEMQFRPEDLDFPARPVDMNDGTNRLGKTFGKRPPSQSIDPIKELKKVGQVQRGEPEMSMLRVQEKMGGGVLNPVVEHVGDITHRMVDLLEFDESQMGNVLSKVDKGIRALRHGYGFAKEMSENIRNNAEARGVPVEQLQAEIDESLKAYAEAHRRVPVYNEALFHGREASVALGEQQWETAAMHLEAIKRMIDEGTYEEIVRQYDPEFATKKGAP